MGQQVTTMEDTVLYFIDEHGHITLPLQPHVVALRSLLLTEQEMELYQNRVRGIAARFYKWERSKRD